MPFNPNIHHRRSIRLREYDYSQEGLYFVIICTHERECLFGEIVNGEMQLNEFGKIVYKCWLEISQYFPNLQLHEHIIMPNHIHGIIEITNRVGAENLLPNEESHTQIKRTEDFLPLPPRIQMSQQTQCHEFQKMIPKSVAAILKGFKIGVTKWFRQNTDIYVVWQRNYHEHIIRNGNSYAMIADYIVNNPAKWTDDKFYKA